MSEEQRREAPIQIYLQWTGCDADEPNYDAAPDVVTWCEDKIYNTDVVYVRSDTIDCDADGALTAKSPEMYDLLLQLSRCVVYGEGGTIQVIDWQMLEEVLRGGYAIYQEVEKI